MQAEGFDVEQSQAKADEFYGRLGSWMNEAVALGQENYAGPDDFLAIFDRLLDSEIDRLA